MRLGGKIFLKIDDYKKLLHEEHLSVGRGSELTVRPFSDTAGTGEYVELGFELSLDDMPGKDLMMAWMYAFYEGKADLMMDLKQRIAEQLAGKKLLEQDGDQLS